MKKLNLILAFIIGLTVLSCSSEDPISNNSKSLTSITKEYYSRNNETPYLTEKLNFNNNKLISIEYSDGSYDEMEYTENLLTKISEFDLDSNLEWITTYSYDSAKRLISKQVVPYNAGTDVSRKKDIIYEGNEIKTTLAWSDDGLQKNIIVTNENNLMIEDKLYNPNDVLMSSYIFNYDNGNLSKVTNVKQDGSTFFEITYTYLDKKVTDQYLYTKYLFGNEWKNNSSLNKQNGLGHSDSFEISERYIQGYSMSGDISETVSFDYEFDAEDNILKQIRNLIDVNGVSYKTISSYQYN